MATKNRYIDEDGLEAFAVRVKVFVEKKVANSGGGGGGVGTIDEVVAGSKLAVTSGAVYTAIQDAIISELNRAR